MLLKNASKQWFVYGIYERKGVKGLPKIGLRVNGVIATLDRQLHAHSSSHSRIAANRGAPLSLPAELMAEWFVVNNTALSHSIAGCNTTRLTGGAA